MGTHLKSLKSNLQRLEKMVTFSCGTCNESLKKQKVEQHYYRCRNDYVTCIDCNHDFFGNDFESHTKCVSEAQRYGGVNFKGKANKGEAKQNAWIESIEAAMENASLSGQAQKVLGIVGANENIPRKKKKFDNFIKNTCRFASQTVIDEIWEAINVKNPDPPKPQQTPEPTPEIPEENNNTKKRKMDEGDSGVSSPKKWKWSKEIKDTLRASEQTPMKIKSLRKLCFAKAKNAGVELIEKDEFLNKMKKVKKLTINEADSTVSI